MCGGKSFVVNDDVTSVVSIETIFGGDPYPAEGIAKRLSYVTAAETCLGGDVAAKETGDLLGLDGICEGQADKARKKTQPRLRCCQPE